jgi:hypothetical protein
VISNQSLATDPAAYNVMNSYKVSSRSQRYAFGARRLLPFSVGQHIPQCAIDPKLSE